MNGTAVPDADAPGPLVVVGIDGSQAAIKAAEWAVEEAISREVPLRLMYAIPEHAESAPFAAVGNERMEYAYGETALRMAAAAAGAVDKTVKVETAVLRGDPAVQLAANSRSAAMICVGSTGIGHIAKMLLGSTATELAKAAHCSVAIIRSQRTRHVSGRPLIAVAVDSSPGNDIVVKQAMEEARRRLVPLLALGAWRSDQQWLPAGELDRRMKIWGNRYPDVRIHTLSTRRDVAEFLAVIDRQVALTVLGANDADQIAGLVGPHRHPVLGKAQCSVLVARP
jgi:nucleotide-binding universal stress UspA family protein